jgi:vacuolar protein sorting-associated protein 51
MASPRPSASLLRSPPSSRTSLDTTSQPSSFSRATHPQARRNRAALRDYYGLRAQIQDSVASPTDQSRSSSVEPSQRDADTASTPPQKSHLQALDHEGFDAGSYVKRLLETEPLGELLALENELVSDIRNLDGERKALVYDNYSKLITATDTIKKVFK